MKKVEKKTSICSILCVILSQNSENTYFGHFLVENWDTGRKKSFCNSAPPNMMTLHLNISLNGEYLLYNILADFLIFAHKCTPRKVDFDLVKSELLPS